MKSKRQTIDTFSEALSSLATQPGPASSRTITFWCGAGFSRAWSPNSPTEGSLFSIPKEKIAHFKYLHHVLSAIGWENNDCIGFEGFKTLQYVLDMQLKHPDIRNRYLDDQNLRLSINEMRTFVHQNFESLGSLNFIDDESLSFPLRDVEHDYTSSILPFFQRVIGMTSLNQGSDIGLRPQFITTNYDYTIETILDNSEHRDGSILNNIYRGITPEYICGKPTWQQPIGNFEYSLIKLNGGFEILSDGDRYNIDYRKRSSDELQENPPILILPSREQDYADSYFKAIFPKAVRILRESQILLIIGYSMPREDALVLFILRQFAESGLDAQGKYVFCIDLKGPDVLEKRLNWNFSSIKTTGWPKIMFYNGGFEMFCKEYIQHTNTN